MDWLIFTYRLPAEPSRHRVAVWRELRRAGAHALQQAAWAVPARGEFVEAVSRSAALVERAGGEAFVFEATPHGEDAAAQLERSFTAEREDEWQEFLAECTKFEQEIEREIASEKFTAAELDEEDQNLDRLRRWFRKLRGRDVFVAPGQELASQRLSECEGRLDEFAERVYRHRGAE